MNEKRIFAVITELHKQPKELWHKSVDGGYDLTLGDGIVNVYLDHLKIYDDKKNKEIFINPIVTELYHALDNSDTQQREDRRNRILDGVLKQLQSNQI